MSFGPQLITDSEARALITLDTPVVRLTVFDTALYVLRDILLSTILLSIFLIPLRFSSFWPLHIHAPQDKGDFYALILLLFVPWVVHKIALMLWRRFRQLVIALRGGHHWFMALSRDHLLLNINPALYQMPEQKNLTCIDIRVADVRALCHKRFKYPVGKTIANAYYVLVKLKDMPCHELVRFVEDTNVRFSSVLTHHYGVPYCILRDCNLFVLWPETVYPSLKIAFKLFGKIIPEDPAEPYLVRGAPGENL